MGALTGLIAHGGVAGAVVEGLIAALVVGAFLAVWLRERRGSRSSSSKPTKLRDGDDLRP